MNRDTLLGDLTAQVARGRLVVIAGTGVSISACGDQEVSGNEGSYAVARWDGLLLHGVDRCVHTEHVLDADEARIVRLQIKCANPDFLVSAAELVSGRLRGKSPGTYHRWLKDTVGELDPTHPEILNVLAAFPGVLATLNYDGLLEKAAGREPITWQDADKVEEVLRGDRTDAVVHLHGYYDKPDSVVLGLRSYIKVIEDPHTRSVLQLFTIDRTLLFVGCGGAVTDPNFARLIKWAKDAKRQTTHRHFLLCSERDADKLRADLQSAPWLHVVAYGDDHSRLLPFLMELQRAARSAPKSTPVRTRVRLSLDLPAYAKAVRDRYAMLKLERVDATGSYYRELELWHVFIPQNVRECQEYLPQVFELPKEHLRRLRESGQWEGGEMEADRLEDLRCRYLEQSPRNALDLVDDPGLPHLVLLGDPGSGKSSLLQALALQWADAPESQRAGLDLPLLVELRAYAQAQERGQTADFLHFIEHGYGIPFRLDDGALKEGLHDGRVRVFFDGLDEVFDPALREQVVIAIERFANEFPRARIIVTSRVIGYKGESLRGAGFRHFMLQDLDDEQIATFLDRWHRDTYRPADAAERDEKHSRLSQAIAESPAIQDLVGNPLLLTMAAILNRYRDLPRDRAELYEECAKLLLQQWKVEEALRADEDLKQDALAIGLREKQAILRRLAREMQNGSEGALGNMIESARLEVVIEETVRPLVKGNARAVTRALIRHLRERNFILCFAGGDSYAFVHRTFLEYFCADDLRARFDHEKSIDAEFLKREVYGRHWPDESWHEVLCLLAGLIHPSTVSGILEFLLAEPDPRLSCQHIFLAARCVGEVRNPVELGLVGERAMDRLRDLTRFDLPYYYQDYGEDARRVGEVHSRAVILAAAAGRNMPAVYRWLKAHAQSDDDPGVRQVAVRVWARGWKDHPETLSWLKTRAQSDEDPGVRQMALQELARGWKDDPETLPWLKACAGSDEDAQLSQTAVRELAQGWRDDPETLTILKTRAQSDDYPGVRQAALQELARGWKDDPETLSILRACAQSDEDRDARRTAVQELAQGWRDDPKTLPWLKARAQSDEDPYVRQAAVQELAQGWRDDPETLPWIKACVELDEDGDVRGTAVQGLAQGWRGDPKTLPWLKARVQSSQDADVRLAAVSELARGWKDDLETLPILKALAQSDGDGIARWIAVERLMWGWKDDPETLPILKAMARSDDDYFARVMAVEELARGWKDDPETLSIVKARV
jgi:predicted NACHT family NTPase